MAIPPHTNKEIRLLNVKLKHVVDCKIKSLIHKGLLSETGINYINKGHNRFNIVNYPNGSSKTERFLQLYSISFKTVSIVILNAKLRGKRIFLF